MKTLRLSFALALFTGGTLFAQPSTAGAIPNPEIAQFPALRTAEELEQLVGPIALYPDALIAIILPASASSTDIVLAARYQRDFPNDRSQVENRAWDESVKSLTHYPEVLKWMDENLPWTKQLGDAFTSQPADVMQAIQRLRARARASGALVDTPQQQVLAEPEVIRIVPAQPDVIYVPRYEPELVFLPTPVYYTQPLLTFGLGVRAGSWLAFDCDWHRRTIWVGDRHRTWRGHDWHRPVVAIAPRVSHVMPHGVRQWRPPPGRNDHHHTTSVVHQRSTTIARPSTHVSNSQRSWSRSNHSEAPRPAAVVAPTRTVTAPAPSQRQYSPRSTQRESTNRIAAASPAYTSPTPSAVSPPQPVMTATPSPRSSGWQQRSERNDSNRRAEPSASRARTVVGPQPPPNSTSSAASQPRMTSRPNQAVEPPAATPQATVAAAPAPSTPPRPSSHGNSRGNSGYQGRRGDDSNRR